MQNARRILSDPKCTFGLYRPLYKHSLSEEAQGNISRATARLAYLETDPSHREIPENYKLRYMGFACTEIEDALRSYEQLKSSIGRDKMREVESQDDTLGLTLADSMLARDRLRAGLESGAKKVEEMEKSGLRKEDLTFCN